MINILFVCLGNICRSPMAEFVMKDLVKKAQLLNHFNIESAATSAGEAGNPVYPPAAAKLAEHGISCAGKTARRILSEDYNKYDFIIGMDHNNIKNMHRAFGGDPNNKISRLLDWTDSPGDIADPWYTGDFDATWSDVLNGCSALLLKLMPNREF